MAIKTVNGTTARPYVHVEIRLSQAAVITATGQDAPALTNVTGDGTGAYTTTLWANGDLTPSPTFYTVTEYLGGTDNTFTIIVPQTVGPFTMAAIASVPPGAALGSTMATINAAGDIAGRSFTASSDSGPYTSLLLDGLTPTPAGAVSGKFYDAGGTVLNALQEGADPAASDNSPFINAAIAAVATAGGGEVVISKPGTYDCNYAGTVTDIGNTLHYCILMKSGVRLWLQEGVTLRLKASQANGNDSPAGANHFYVFSINEHAGSSGDERMWIVGQGTIDGNAANQTHTSGGVYYYRCRFSGAIGVTAKNFRGTASSGVNETFHFEYYLGANGLFDNCNVLGTAGSTASAFSADFATDVEWRNCHAYGMTVAQGFTHYGCAQMLYAHCTAGQNGSHGFNSEMSDSVKYIACISGGLADGVDASYLPWPFTSGQSLGNTAEGFQIKGDVTVGADLSAPSNRVELISCQSRNNGADGLIARNVTGLKLIGGEFSSNTGQGINLRGCTGPILDNVAAQLNTVNGLRATQSITDATQTTKLRIVGGAFNNNNQSAAGSEGDGIFLTSSTTAMLLGVTGIDTQGSKTQRYGLELAGSARVTVIGADFQANLTGTYLDTPGLSWFLGTDLTGRQIQADGSSLSTPGFAQIASATATPAGGTANGKLIFGSSPALGVYFGSGAPTVSAPKGSLYLRTDGTTTNDRAYINTNGTTTWTALTTVA